MRNLERSGVLAGIHVEDADAPRIRHHQPGDQADERRFTRTVGADEPGYGSGIDPGSNGA